jgi:hypothetical protein
MCSASFLPASGILYITLFSVSTLMPASLSLSGTLMFLISASCLPSGWKLITPRSSASSSPSSGSGLVPPTTYTHVTLLAPPATLMVVWNMPLVSRYLSDPQARK